MNNNLFYFDDKRRGREGGSEWEGGGEGRGGVGEALDQSQIIQDLSIAQSKAQSCTPTYICILIHRCGNAVK